MRSLRAPELIGSLLHLLRGLGELGIAAIARELLKLASHLLRLVDHLLLLSLRASSAAALLLHLRTHLLFELLLLPAREFREPPRDLVLLLTLILLLLILDGLILILHLVELKLEQIRQLLLLLLLLTLPLPLPARDLNIPEDRFGSQQLLQASLLGRKGFFGLLPVQLIDRARHFFCGLSYIFYKLGELRF